MTEAGAGLPVRNRGVLMLAVGFVVLLASAIWLYWTVVGATNYQRAVRYAQRERSTVFRAMIDQETSLRGFTSTGRIDFLVPYGESQASIDGAFNACRIRLRQLGTYALLRAVDDEAAVHQRWHDTVAAPLLAHRRRPDALALQYAGKRLMDRFRIDDKIIDDGIGEAAADADNAVTVAVIRIAIVTGILGITFTLAYFIFAAGRSRILAEALRQRVLYENEKRIADALQAAFVQKALPVLPNLGFHASYVPAGAEAQVGGDWYDAFELPDGRILVSIGDVAGHGIEAAVIMSRARQAIISSALHETDPGAVLRKANETLMLQDAKMVTAVCGYIDPATLEIVYATAGHPAPILAFRDSAAYFLEHDGLPLGILPNVHYASFTAHACAGALLLLYTDGVIEHKRDLIEGERRLLEAAQAAAAQGAADPASSVRMAIFADKLPVDDVAIMTVSFAVGAAARTATVNANATCAAVGVAPAFLRVRQLTV
jgi:CHASE3 domain sensor protein